MVSVVFNVSLEGAQWEATVGTLCILKYLGMYHVAILPGVGPGRTANQLTVIRLATCVPRYLSTYACAWACTDNEETDLPRWFMLALPRSSHHACLNATGLTSASALTPSAYHRRALYRVYHQPASFTCK